MRCFTGSKEKDRFKNFTHLIIDEIHEREINTDLLLIAIRDGISENPHLKVILMSATLDADQFSSYFNNCLVINVPGRLFEVKIFHLDEVLAKTGYKSEDMNLYIMENQCTEATNDFMAAYNATNFLRNNQIDHALLNHVIMHIHNQNSTKGSILVFLPGYQDILHQKKMIEDNDGRDYRLFVLHSGVNEASVFERMTQGIRKIILSTNIAETSLTINDVVS